MLDDSPFPPCVSCPLATVCRSLLWTSVMKVLSSSFSCSILYCDPQPSLGLQGCHMVHSVTLVFKFLVVLLHTCRRCVLLHFYKAGHRNTNIEGSSEITAIAMLGKGAAFWKLSLRITWLFLLFLRRLKLSMKICVWRGRKRCGEVRTQSLVHGLSWKMHTLVTKS